MVSGIFCCCAACVCETPVAKMTATPTTVARSVRGKVTTDLRLISPSEGIRKRTRQKVIRRERGNRYAVGSHRRNELCGKTLDWQAARAKAGCSYDSSNRPRQRC